MADSIQVYKRTPERDRILTAVPRRSHVPTGNKVQNVSTRRGKESDPEQDVFVCKISSLQSGAIPMYNGTMYSSLDIEGQGTPCVVCPLEIAGNTDLSGMYCLAHKITIPKTGEDIE